MPTLNTDALRRLALQLLRVRGTPDDIAADVALHLTLAERSGHASHGLSILPSYLDAAAAGLLDVAARPEILADTGGTLSYDGHRGFGQHVGQMALAAACERAHRHGHCFLAIRNSFHLGRAGHYGELAAQAGLVYLSFINVIGRAPMVAPFGGREARLSTNPLCFAGPLPDGRPPFVLDYATSGIAANKARLIAARGERLAPGLMIDAAGLPTDDPAALSADPPGALLPFGGHKGYALGLVAELLAGVLAGGGTLAPTHPRDGGLRNNLFAILIDADRFGARAWQMAESAAFVDYVTGCPTAPGVERVLLPGEIEAEGQRATLRTLDMDEAAWRLFADCARSAGLAPDDALAQAAPRPGLQPPPITL